LPEAFQKLIGSFQSGFTTFRASLFYLVLHDSHFGSLDERVSVQFACQRVIVDRFGPLASLPLAHKTKTAEYQNTSRR
jgi:hypothetical protein